MFEQSDQRTNSLSRAQIFLGGTSSAKYFNALTLDYGPGLCKGVYITRSSTVPLLLKPLLSRLSAFERVHAIFQIALMAWNRVHLYSKTVIDYILCVKKKCFNHSNVVCSLNKFSYVHRNFLIHVL